MQVLTDHVQLDIWSNPFLEINLLHYMKQTTSYHEYFNYTAILKLVALYEANNLLSRVFQLHSNLKKCCFQRSEQCCSQLSFTSLRLAQSFLDSVSSLFKSCFLYRIGTVSITNVNNDIFYY